MSDEPANKKIKLSLEPFIDNNVVDITNTGQEILKTETSLPEKLMQSVDRIWFERGEWKDITEASLRESIENQKQGNTNDEKSPDSDTDDKENAFLPPPGFDINKLRESVINKLFHAKSEIDVALDVINILAASNRASATVKDLVLPVGSLTATYVTKPKPTTKAQLESVQLNLGLKRKKQKQASEFLKNSAATLKKIVEKDQVFWEEALDLRRNNWQMQSNPQHGGIHAGSSFLVQYGFAEVGSDFIETAVGEMKRAEDNSDQLQLALPHGTPRKMAVRIDQSNMGRLGLGKNDFSEGILGMMNEEDQQQQSSIYFTTMIGTSHSDIQNQLAEAYSTVFDAELFSDILAEAQALNSNVRFPDDEIVINIDGQIDLSISKIPITNNTFREETITPQQIISRSIDLAFRLLLLQHQRYNIWKAKARTLSHNHRIKQLLLQNDILQQQEQQQQQAQQQAQQQQQQQQQQVAGSTTTSAVGTPTSTAAAANTTATSNNPSTPSNTTSATGTNGAAVSNSVANTPSASGGNTVSGVSSRARTKTSNLTNNAVYRDLPKQIPILSPIMSFTRFWVQFDRARHVLNQITSPFRYGGFSITTHFKFLNTEPFIKTVSYDAYPGHGELALSLGISILKGPSLHFGLSQSGSISVYLSQTTVVLQNVSEFEAFLAREIKVICLLTVCDVANELLQQSEGYAKASGSDKQSFLWKLDRVDEAIHGTVYWNKQWRNITVRLNTNTPVYVLEFTLSAMQDVKESTYEIELGKSSDVPSAMNFKEKVSVIVKQIMRDAQF